jgi:Spy/CpxP family protein refolding chaperone
MQRSIPRSRTFGAAAGLRLLAVTAVLAVAGGLTQTAYSAPGDGYRHHGGPGAIGQMGAIDGMGGMFMGHPRQMESLYDSVGVTAEQRAQIRQIMDAARSDLQSQREAGRQLRDQAQALFVQPTVDASQAEALRQQMLARHDQASRRMLQAMLDVSAVLTPDQRQAIGERMNERRERMERRRAERAQGAPARP